MSSNDQGKTTDHFSAEFIAKMKTILEEEQQKLQTELEKFAKKNPRDDDDWDANDVNYGDEEDDQVHEMEEYTVNKTLEITLEKKLRDVKAALGRMENNTYGICKYTGKPISEKRLMARPTSSSSVEAKKVLTSEN